MAQKASRAPDRRVLRTHRLLREALVSLVLERGWDATSVQDVCERADVGRSTFYTHFADKEELLTSGLATLRRHLRASLEPAAEAGPPRPLAFLPGLLAHVQEEARVFRALVGKRSGQVAQQRFRQMLLELVREDLAPLAPASPDVRLEATARYVTGALTELLTWWLDTRGAPPLAELEARFQQLTAPVLRELPRLPCAESPSPAKRGPSLSPLRRGPG